MCTCFATFQNKETMEADDVYHLSVAFATDTNPTKQSTENYARQQISKVN